VWLVKREQLSMLFFAASGILLAEAHANYAFRVFMIYRNELLAKLQLAVEQFLCSITPFMDAEGNPILK
jgi:hypothetical protein